MFVCESAANWAATPSTSKKLTQKRLEGGGAVLRRVQQRSVRIAELASETAAAASYKRQHMFQKHN